MSPPSYILAYMVLDIMTCSCIHETSIIPQLQFCSVLVVLDKDL